MRQESQSTHRPVAGRPREFDESEVINKAVRVFSERGFHAASITDLSQAMDLTCGSIYKAFKDKRGVFIAALDQQSSQRSYQIMREIDAVRTGRDKLRALLMFYARISCGEEGRRGCLVVGTAVELSTFDPDIAARVHASLEKREHLLIDLLQLGQRDGSVSTAIDVKATARLLLCLLQGVRVVGKTSPSRAEMTAAVNAALKLID